jgi:hypothetical protein
VLATSRTSLSGKFVSFPCAATVLICRSCQVWAVGEMRRSGSSQPARQFQSVSRLLLVSSSTFHSRGEFERVREATGPRIARALFRRCSPSLANSSSIPLPAIVTHIELLHSRMTSAQRTRINYAVTPSWSFETNVMPKTPTTICEPAPLDKSRCANNCRFL